MVIGDEAGEGADADAHLDRLSQPEHGVDLIGDAVRPNMLGDEPGYTQRP